MEAPKALAPKTKTSAGVWALPDGDAYYAASVHSNTTDQDRAPAICMSAACSWLPISARSSTAACKKQGLKKGPIGERIKALDADPRFPVPEN